MHPTTVAMLVQEVAPKVAGARVVNAYTARRGCLILELSPAAAPASGGPSSSDGPRVLGIVTLKAMPLMFLADRPEGLPLTRGEPPQGIAPELAGATVIGLATPADSVVTLTFRKILTTGRTVDRALSVDLGRRPRMAMADAGNARGGAATNVDRQTAQDEAIAGGRPTVAWWHDSRGRIHVRLSASGAPEGAEGARGFASMNDAALFAFAEFFEPLRLGMRRSAIRRRIATALKRKRRAADRVRADLEAAGQAEEHRHKARLLLTRQKEIRRAPRVELMDYDGKTPVTVELDPALTPAQNAEILFKRARKADRKARAAPARLEQIERDEARLRGLADRLERASEAEISALESEFGVGRAAGGAPRGVRARYRTYKVAGGWEVLVGRSNRDNDVLTYKIAKPSDLWFHVRQAPGSHVILRRHGGKAEPDKQAILEAAAIAAFHSKAGRSTKVPVCYTERRHVRKPRGAPPGLAVVKQEKVVFVDPKLPPT